MHANDHDDAGYARQAHHGNTLLVCTTLAIDGVAVFV
jgi:hypothetical protein